MEWVLIMTLVILQPGMPNITTALHTQEFSTQQACLIAGVQWKKHTQEELTKANIGSKVVVLAGCTPKSYTNLPPLSGPDVI